MFMNLCRCSDTLRDKLKRNEVEILQVATPTQEKVTFLYPSSQRDAVRLSLKNVGVDVSSYAEDGANST